MIAIVPYLNIGVKHHINYHARWAQKQPRQRQTCRPTS
jgi:hypothetical protein